MRYFQEQEEKRLNRLYNNAIFMYYIKTTSLIIFVAILLNCNCWFTEKGLLKSVQFIDNKCVRIVNIVRNVCKYSLVVFETEDGSFVQYELDTDILFNVSFKNRQNIDKKGFYNL